MFYLTTLGTSHLAIGNLAIVGIPRRRGFRRGHMPPSRPPPLAQALPRLRFFGDGIRPNLGWNTASWRKFARAQRIIFGFRILIIREIARAASLRIVISEYRDIRNISVRRETTTIQHVAPYISPSLSPISF